MEDYRLENLRGLKYLIEMKSLEEYKEVAKVLDDNGQKASNETWFGESNYFWEPVSYLDTVRFGSWTSINNWPGNHSIISAQDFLKANEVNAEPCFNIF